jgi:NTP pyrophosphatase (non-canonical NTP hydrolase)
MAKSIAKMDNEIADVNEANGWFDSDRSFGDDIALLHSEVSEAFEAYRQFGTQDATELTGNGNWIEGKWCPKPEGVGSELADVYIRLLDTCKRYGIDLEAEYNRKIAYNRTRGYRHGGKKV